MAKRKAKQRTKTNSKKVQNRPARPVNAKRQGLKLFKLGNYDQAIAAWEQERQRTPDAKLTAALAEAYFRRGVKQQERADVTTAVSLQQDNPLYQYHMGLAQQRDGDFDKAIKVYQRVAKVDEQWAKRTAFVLALAYQQQEENPARQAVWSQLSSAEQAQFEQLRRVQDKNRGISTEDAVMWQGIAAYANGRYAESETLLTKAIASRQETTLAHYYLGNLAAQQDNWKTAVSHWERARADGFDSPTLTNNLGEAYHRLAEEAVQQEAYQDALGYGQSAAALKGEFDNPLNQLLAHTHQQLGYQSASVGEWDDARIQWKLAEQQSQSNFRLACNLALAHEKEGDYDAAAEQWRDALRRRPRKADHPDAISDEAVAQLWIRTAVSYQKSEEYDEANKVMKQAVKWQPDNLDIRLELVDGYVNNGQLLAAENELGRILERDGDNIPALTRMGEVISQSEYWWQASGAIKYWEKVLKLDPNNEDAPLLLAEHYQELGDHAKELWYADYREAINYYRQGLQYQPENGELLLAIAECYFKLKEEELGETMLKKALALPVVSPEILLKATSVWYIADRPEDAANMMPLYKEKFPDDTLPLYMATAVNCLFNDRPEWAAVWIEQSEREHPDAPIYPMIGQGLMANGAPFELVEEYMQKAIALNQEKGQCYFVLGSMYAASGDLDMARKQWKLAKKDAHKTKNSELKEQIAEAEKMFNNPLRFLSRLFREEFGLDDDDFDFDDMEFDDDDFF